MWDISGGRFSLRKLKQCQLEVSNRSVALVNLDGSVYSCEVWEVPSVYSCEV
jgi:hypothetical protein